MAKRTTFKKTTQPIHTVHIDNESIGDKSGYLGLILNVNKNGKAIRVATRDGAQRIHILLSEVPAFKEALDDLVANGVATSTKEVKYDTGVKNKFLTKSAKTSARRAA